MLAAAVAVAAAAAVVVVDLPEKESRFSSFGNRVTELLRPQNTKKPA